MAAKTDANKLIFDAALCKLSVQEAKLARTSDDLRKAREELASAKEQLEQDVGSAIAVAAKSADVKAATKAFYVAAATYCGRPTATAETELDKAEESLKLEMKLAEKKAK